jgi:adenylate kinase family enzyme
MSVGRPASEALRISVVGSSGAGKTTFARAISKVLGVPHLELDSVFHQPEWTRLPDSEFRARVANYCEQPAWVIDGNYTSQGVLDIVWRRAETVVWLDPPVSVVIRRVIWRSLSRGLLATPLWNGNRERLRDLLRTAPAENVVLWAATRFRSTRRKYSARTADPAWAHLRVHQLRNAREQSMYLRSLARPT